MNLADIRTDLYDRLSLTTTPPTAVSARLDRFINQTHKRILAKKGFTKLRRHVLTAACVANEPFMTLPQAMTRVIIVTDRVNRWPLDEISIQDSRRRDPGIAQLVSYPNAYYVDNFSSATARDPSAACQPFVVSDDAADGATKKVYIEGIITGGYFRSASIAMNGLTPVAVDALATWVYIQKFYFQNTAGTTASPTGNVTLTEGSGGNELARLGPGRSYGRYTRLGLYGTPTQANTYYVDGDLHVSDMAQADDEPLIPEDWHPMIVSGALAMEYRKRERLDLMGAEMREFKEMEDGLKLYLASQSGVARNPQTPALFSQLGPNFPAGS